MPTYNIAREVTTIQYFDDVHAESPEQAKLLIKEGYWLDHEETIKEKEPEILSWAEVVEHPNSSG